MENIIIDKIRKSAYVLHDSVGQIYDIYPYGFHLDMVAKKVMEVTDRVPLIFAAYYHDSIEDARLTYNDVLEVAKQYMSEEEAIEATEIVYALTNDKGKTREERAGEKYYESIRNTPGASLVKVCDRIANMTFSRDTGNKHMFTVYKQEQNHFIEKVGIENVPNSLIEELKRL